ncbi:MAG: hypothetical protein HY814_01480 [Candidatus Riflebacteria bacterium]|nr:hypothetical protein [Candidatus Riflebacteria bacterium]
MEEENEAPKEQVKVSCENDCDEGFDVYMTQESLILVCRACETEYEISGSGHFTASAQDFQ